MSYQSNQARQQAEQRYRDIRRESREVIIEQLRRLSNPQVDLSDITEEALEQADVWRTKYPIAKHSYIPGWSWRKVVAKFRRRPRRLEVALWQDVTLCGLAVGRISDRCVVATIHYIESMPEGNPLQGKVVPFIVRYLEALAVSLGCESVTIERPVEDLMDYYSMFGFDHRIMKGSRVVRQVKRLKGYTS
jgi:hypothetical protein